MRHVPWSSGASALPSSTVFFMLLALLIAFPISIVAFVLQMIASSILRSHTPDSVLALPANLKHSSTVVQVGTLPSNLAIGTSIATAVFAAFAALAFWELRMRYFDERGEKSARIWAWANVCVTLVNLGVTVGCVVSVMLMQTKDAKKWLDVNVLGESDELERTRETWLCKIKDVQGMDGDWARIGCGFAVSWFWLRIMPSC
jgi:hypothetical protein